MLVIGCWIMIILPLTLPYLCSDLWLRTTWPWFPPPVVSSFQWFLFVLRLKFKLKRKDLEEVVIMVYFKVLPKSVIWSDWRKPRKSSVSLAFAMVKIQTGYLLNTGEVTWVSLLVWLNIRGLISSDTFVWCHSSWNNLIFLPCPTEHSV